jgi:hypothetical protein
MFNNPKFNPSVQLMRRNKGSYYSEAKVLSELNERFVATFNSSNEPMGEKNLVYFTLNHSLEYIDLFFYCISSLVNKNDPASFDLLVICPSAFEKIINELIYDRGIDLKGFNLLFHTVPEAKDGVEASMNKLKIYQWQHISYYGRVLFLDVDILAKEPVGELFDLQLNPDKFYSAIHNVSANLHHTKFHKLVDYDLGKMNEFSDKGIYAFNAGQYLFVNSLRMMHHMYNVDWLTLVWPGEYFFEQSFLNHYFNWFSISDVHLLDPYVKFVAVHLWDKGDFTHEKKLNYSIVHFAGHACDAHKKIQYIRNFNPELIIKNV